MGQRRRKAGLTPCSVSLPPCSLVCVFFFNLIRILSCPALNRGKLNLWGYPQHIATYNIVRARGTRYSKRDDAKKKTD